MTENNRILVGNHLQISEKMSITLKDLEHILRPFMAFEETVAVAVGGSIAAGISDDESDVDIYIYCQLDIPVEVRYELASALGRSAQIDSRLWEPGDQWIDIKTGRLIDIIYRNPRWMIDQIRRVLVDFEPSLGYTTTIWDNLLYSATAHDPSGWYEDLRKTAVVPYPPELQKAVIGHNYKALKGSSTGFFSQLSTAVRRGDPISVNHRITAVLSSYFDILFAANKVTNPGEKRLLETAKKRCRRLPRGYPEDVSLLVSSVSWMSGNITEAASSLLDRLDRFLEEDNLLPL